MRSFRLLFFLAILLGLGTGLSQAEKFSSSLYQDTGSSISDQTMPSISRLPQQVSGEKMPKTTSTSFPEAPAAADSIPRMPTAEADRPMPSLPRIATPPISSPNAGYHNQAIPTLKNPFEVKAPRISSPNLEAKFKKLLQQQEEKTKKKKKLSEAIRDELMNYGLFFLLGLAAILLIYALRKEAPSSKPHAEAPKEMLDKPRDIWKEEF
jgi:hypothetical protein